MRSDAGNYAVTATNFWLDDSNRVLGTGTGSFSLDVLYSPTFETKGTREHYVLLGDSLSLLCGTGLDSNPAATITWTAPDMTTIMDNARYDLENGPEIVRLNFTHTIPSDTGVWVCEATAVSEKYIVNNGQLVRQGNAVIGRATVNIQVNVIATPDKPAQVVVDNSGATWVVLNWNVPDNTSLNQISGYEILVREVNSSRRHVNTTTNGTSTSFNITGLSPATTYDISVVAVSGGGDIIVKSTESTLVEVTTGVTTPKIVCSKPGISNGVITVNWMYVHTGGLSLIDVLVKYSYQDDLSLLTRTFTVYDLNSTSVTLSSLNNGFQYTFMVSATNSYGTSTVTCGSVDFVSDSETPSTNSGSGDRNNTGGIVGGVITTVIIIITAVTVLTVLLIIYKFRAKTSKSGKVDEDVIYEEPENIIITKTIQEPESVQLKDCPAYQTIQDEESKT